MTDEPIGDDLLSLSVRGWASWLSYGIKAHFLLTTVPPSFSPPDAFPGAQDYIGRNPRDLAADLVDLQRDLPAAAQSRFEDATLLVWSELDFDRYEHYRIGEIALAIAQKARLKGIVDLIAGALPKLRRVRWRSDLQDPLSNLCRAMFVAAVDLATASSHSAAAIRALMDEQRQNGGLQFAVGKPAISGLVRLCSNVPTEIATWIAFFSGHLRSILLEDPSIIRTTRHALEKACGGEEEFDEVVRRMRGQALGDASPTDGHVLMRHWISADALLTLLVPLSKPDGKAHRTPSGSAFSFDDTAGALNIG